MVMCPDSLCLSGPPALTDAPNVGVLLLLRAGQAVDAYVQPPPGPWDIPATPSSFFMDSKQVIKVPYTSSMKVGGDGLGGCKCGCVYFLLFV